MSPWLFNVYTDAVVKELKRGMVRKGVKFQEEGREWRVPGILIADDLVLCGESEEDLRTILRRFIETCWRRGLEVNTGKSKVMLLGGEEGLECGVYVNELRLEHVSEFKYFGCVLDESDTDKAQCSRKVASGRRVAGPIRSLVNARSLQHECARVLHESLLLSVLMYGSETMI